ncbi:thrombopoietin isoform X2 [Danio aesculapii]|uniref:thrombopoietin isoform X2 n=1 Tax=Danio aesculapii TaxID=1142201 RepID=UPI0024BFDECB|nr:thrombopoietin isoform X2 [Danio aesculapii]
MESNVTGDFMLSLGMDLSRVLVVVFSMVVSELSHVHTRPIDFVCDSEARRVMNKVKDLQEEKVVCSGVDALPSSIQLPCISIHKATWERKSVQERRAEILLSLGTLAQDVRSAKTLSQPGCGLTLLKRLEHSINNYLHVVRLLHVEERRGDSDTYLTREEDGKMVLSEVHYSHALLIKYTYRTTPRLKHVL